MQTLVDRLQDGYRTKSIMNDLKKDGISSEFSEASRRKLKEMGNFELYELGEKVRTTQCYSCLRYSKEGTVYCLCGMCSDALDVVKQGTHGERHGPEEWQYHHWKAKDATTNIEKRGYSTVAKRWNADLSFRETPQEHGWTLEYCVFLDYL